MNDSVSKAEVLEIYADLYDVFNDNKEICKELDKIYDRINELRSKFAKDTNVPINDCVSRQAMFETVAEYEKQLREIYGDKNELVETVKILKHRLLIDLPSAQPTIYGYDIEHLRLIAEVLRRENLSPERVAEAITDMGKIYAIARDEFEQTLRRAAEQCKT